MLYAQQVNENGFNGTLPDTLSQWTLLSVFKIEWNTFSGTLPDFIGSSWTQMKMFAVNNNTLTGTVPRSLGNWNQAGLVWLADNQFTGTLPDTIVKWSALLFFDVSQCCCFGINATLCAYTWQFSGLPEQVYRLPPTEHW